MDYTDTDNVHTYIANIQRVCGDLTVSPLFPNLFCFMLRHYEK